MTCPFLREAQVKYCQTASLRKLIPLARAGRADEKCSSALYSTCVVYRSQAEAQPAAAAAECPFLRESLMQYCAAAPVAKLVPYSESVLSRCGNDGYRYCELYLSMAHPAQRMDEVDGIPMPGWLSYSANHMWLDVTDDGTCYAGIDAFLSRALGKVERISGRTHAQWILQHPPRTVNEPEEEILGMSFPLDRYYHRGHTWARPEANGTLTRKLPAGLGSLARSPN